MIYTVKEIMNLKNNAENKVIKEFIAKLRDDSKLNINMENLPINMKDFVNQLTIHVIDNQITFKLAGEPITLTINYNKIVPKVCSTVIKGKNKTILALAMIKLSEEVYEDTQFKAIMDDNQELSVVKLDRLNEWSQWIIKWKNSYLKIAINNENMLSSIKLLTNKDVDRMVGSEEYTRTNSKQYNYIGDQEVYGLSEIGLGYLAESQELEILDNLIENLEEIVGTSTSLEVKERLDRIRDIII